MKARISAWRGVSLSMSIALSFYTVTGIIYSILPLAIGDFVMGNDYLLSIWLNACAAVLRVPAPDLTVDALETYVSNSCLFVL